MLNRPSPSLPEKHLSEILRTLALTGVMITGIASAALVQEVRKLLDGAVDLLDKSSEPVKTGGESKTCNSTAFCPLPGASSDVRIE